VSGLRLLSTLSLIFFTKFLHSSTGTSSHSLYTRNTRAYAYSRDHHFAQSLRAIIFYLQLVLGPASALSGSPVRYPGDHVILRSHHGAETQDTRRTVTRIVSQLAGVISESYRGTPWRECKAGYLAICRCQFQHVLRNCWSVGHVCKGKVWRGAHVVLISSALAP
jgi:hypothetical protein